MKEWCFEHPWMTFFLVILALEAAAGVVRSIARIFYKRS